MKNMDVGKKMGGSWAVHGQCAHEIKKKKMGAQKKKSWGNAHFFLAQIWRPTLVYPQQGVVCKMCTC